ncbi:MAG: hydroxymethylbilane synthase [Thermoguttaceae bacterium]|nr:hydroxymethylbilane synthase [Thermoguttaceae bacterium]MDW8039305.1 hydroxymethylbilane synthase [Thermoguttaceae bacterium]
MGTGRCFRIGTRRSALAQWQAQWVAEKLRASGAEVELVLMVTEGDRRQELLADAWTSRGIFTREIQKALLEGQVDLAVHSLKDLPTQPVDGIVLAAVPERGPVGDLLISRNQCPLAQLPAGARIGTGSLRRQAQLLHARPDLQMAPLRGNVDTRLRKLQAGQYDGIVVAEAGLRRLGIYESIWTERLFPTVVLPAVGQGALGIEVRADDLHTLAVVQQLDEPSTHAAVVAERTMLAHLHGGCLAPVAAWGRIQQNQLLLTGRVLDPKGQQMVEVTQSVRISEVLLGTGPSKLELLQEAAELGQKVANQLLALGAGQLIRAAREQ